MNPLKIVIGHRGWVFIGHESVTGDEVTLTEASCIRRWGTKKGLGEIAAGGPTPTTILDSVGTVRLHRLAVIATIDASEEAWAAK
jgi:hypothetical protein